MNPKLPLDGSIYTLTIGRVLKTIVFQVSFVQSHSQSQARLMFVTVAFLLLPDTNLHKQALLTTHSYMTRQHTKLLFVFFFKFFFFKSI